MLKGVRVLDLSRVLAGPWATQLLADLGAEVVKIERPGHGDDTRRWGPPWLGEDDGAAQGESAYFLCANRGKRSVTVDFSSPRGQEIIRRLAAEADVLVENLKTGQLARYGLDHESLKAVNPRLVYCSITGFGQTGADADRAGYDAMIQAMGGLMSITGEPDRPPQKVGVAASDLMCGMYAASGILAALLRARETGQGAWIDLSLFDSQLAWLANQAMNHLLTGEAPVRHGSAHPNIVPYQPFECADGAVMLAVGNDAQFQRWCTVAGHPEWAEDERFRENAGRVTHRQALMSLMNPVMAAHPVAHWLERCREAGIPCGAINDIAQALDEPAARDRGMRIDLAHPHHGALPQVAGPLCIDGIRATSSRPPPLLGQHTEEVLKGLGYGSSEIDQLRSDGVI